jgi:hypothetical protein
MFLLCQVNSLDHLTPNAGLITLAERLMYTEACFDAQHFDQRSSMIF